MNKPRILIIGATGKVGSIVVETLNQNKDLDVVAAIRTEEQAIRFKEKGVNSRFLDLDNFESIKNAVQGVERMLLLTGYSVDMLKQSKRVLDAAKAANVRYVVHIGASGNDTTEVSHWGWHQMIEAYIEKLGFDYTHIQPEAFMQNLTSFGWLGKGFVANLIKNSRWSWVDAEDVAAAVAAALANPARLHNQTFRLGYDAATIPELADRISSLHGSEISVVNVDPNDFYEQAVAGGADPAYMACIRDQFILNGDNAITNADQIFSYEAFIDLVGRYPNNWDTFLRREKASYSEVIG